MTEAITYERISSSASQISFARLDQAITGDPAFMAAGRDGSLTVTVRGDRLPLRYRVAASAFRFAQYVRLGLVDVKAAGLASNYGDAPAGDPEREFHTFVIERGCGKLAGYVALTQPKEFSLESDYTELRVDGDLAAAGTDRSQLWEAKRLVRRAWMPTGQLGRNCPWWALLALTRTVTALRSEGQLAAMVGDGAPDGSPAMLELLAYDVRTVSARPREHNVTGLYGPMWARDVEAIPFHAVPHPRQVPLLEALSAFLTAGRPGSVSTFLRQKGWTDG